MKVAPINSLVYLFSAQRHLSFSIYFNPLFLYWIPPTGGTSWSYSLCLSRDTVVSRRCVYARFYQDLYQDFKAKRKR